MTVIYALLDPRSGNVRYVGKTTNLQVRLRRHVLDARRDKRHSARWIAGVLAAGLRPEARVLEEVALETWQDRERHWIEKLRAEGHDLTNIALGGIGPTPGPETRARLSVARRGRPPHNKGKKTPDEVRAKLSEAAKRRVARNPSTAYDCMMKAVAAHADKTRGTRRRV